MRVSFDALGLSFTATVACHRGFAGTCMEPPEPEEIRITSLVCEGNEAMFLLDSPNCVEAIHEAAYEAVKDSETEAFICAAEMRAEMRREERLCQ